MQNFMTSTKKVLLVKKSTKNEIVKNKFGDTEKIIIV